MRRCEALVASGDKTLGLTTFPRYSEAEVNTMRIYVRVFRSLFLILAFSMPLLANEIDELKSSADVNAFLKKFDPKAAEDLALDEKTEPKTRFGKNTFHKVDIDGDGATDLIVESKYLCALLWRKDGKHDLEVLDQGSFLLRRYTLEDIAVVAGENRYKIRPTENEDIPAPDSKEEMTLVYKFNNFVEFDPQPDHWKVEKIDISTSGCFGSCPIFDLSIAADGKATYNAKQFNKPDGKFVGTVPQADVNRLHDLINYVGLSRLRTKYSVPWTDDQTATVTITHDGGKTKQISDYGMIGTFGLQALYAELFELRKNQKWTAIK